MTRSADVLFNENAKEIIASKILRGTAEFFETHEWTQKALARNNRGVSCDLYAEKAESFCLYGGLCIVGDPLGANRHGDATALRYLRREVEKRGFKSYLLGQWNDRPRRNKAQVIRLLRTTANKLEKTIKGRS